MDTITIIFAGLIAHVLTAGGIQRAVIVAGPSHNARLMIKSADIVSESGPKLAEDSGAPEGERWFAIAGSTIKFGGLTAGTPVVDASFVEHVPPLSMISDAIDIRSEVDSGRLFSGAAAYVDLPAGVMSARDLFADEATFEGSRWSGAKCLAQHVVFTSRAAAGDTVQIRSSSGAALTIRAVAVLRIENEPAISLAPHFDMYQQLLVGATTFAVPVSTGNSCTSDVSSASPFRSTVGRHLHIHINDVSPSCSDSRYP